MSNREKRGTLNKSVSSDGGENPMETSTESEQCVQCEHSRNASYPIFGTIWPTLLISMEPKRSQRPNFRSGLDRYIWTLSFSQNPLDRWKHLAHTSYRTKSVSSPCVRYQRSIVHVDQLDIKYNTTHKIFIICNFEVALPILALKSPQTKNSTKPICSP